MFAGKIQELPQFGANPIDVFLDLCPGQELPLPGLAARVTDHAGTTTHQCQRAVPRTLEAGERQDLEQGADMKTGRRGVEADVTGDRTAGEMVTCALARGVYKAAGLEIVEEVGRSHS
jgi:hypothetical protein